MSDLHNQTLALASMFQSASMINQLAHGEAINQAAFDCSLDSLFTLNAASTEEIYGHGDGLIQGLKALVDYLAGKSSKPDRLIAYYILSMFKLERSLSRDSEIVEAVQRGFEEIERHSDEFSLSQTARAHRIDGLYQKTLSQIKPRIIVQGDQHHLTHSDNTSRIRALLFAGIRAAVLWRQLGGSRFKLLFSRKKYVAQARGILAKF